jgi:hypothetical protein
MTPDPLTFVRDALAVLPDDPGAATAVDVARLSAIATGLQRHIDDVHSRWLELHDEVARLTGVLEECRQARAVLAPALRDVLLARGFDDIAAAIHIDPTTPVQPPKED